MIVLETNTRLHTLLVAGGIAILALASPGFGGVPDEQGVLHGCYKTKDGSLRIIDSDKDACRTDDEREVRWSQTAQPASYPRALASRDTIRGGFFAYRVANQALPPGGVATTVFFSYPVPLAKGPSLYQVLPPGTSPTELCPGTPANPHASPGVLCLYLTSQGAQPISQTGTVDRTSPFYRFAYFTSFTNVEPTDRIMVTGIWVYREE